MVHSGMVHNMEILSGGEHHSPCVACLKSRQLCSVIPKKSDIENPHVLYCVYSDICSPMQTTTHQDHCYFATFINENSHLMDVSLQKTKNKTDPAFCAYKSHSETLTQEWIAILYMDSGGEYMSTSFKKYLINEGIYHKITNSNMPQENRVSEYMNWTLVKMACTILQDAGLPNSYWKHAVQYTAHILNCVPTCTLPSGITSFEAFSGNKPSVLHLHIFGCKAYVDIPDDKCCKLNSKSLECTFISIAEHKKAFWLVHHLSGRFFEFQNVVFDKDNTQTHVVLDDSGDDDDTPPPLSEQPLCNLKSSGDSTPKGKENVANLVWAISRCLP